MDKRTEYLNKLRSYTEEIDKDLTMILQSFQWDRKLILQHPAMVPCKYDPNHKILPENIDKHEQECILRLNGYTTDEQLLPDPISSSASTLLKLSKADISRIIDTAASSDPTFKKVCIDTFHGSNWLCPLCVGSGELAPLTLGRLQCAYSTDERRAIHDAVVAASPSCHDLTELSLPSGGEDEQTRKTKTRTEILAELRDMRRRRTKYRVAAKSRNYSDVLRDVIKTQMEIYNEVLGEVETKSDVVKLNAEDSKGDNIDGQERSQELSRRERDIDSAKRARERGNIEYKEKHGKYHEEQSRDHKYRHRSGEKRFDNSHHRMRDGHRFHRDESRDRQRDKSRDRDYGQRRERDNKRKERDAIKDSPGTRGKSKDVDNNEQRDSDTERARNLLTEIKRKIESVEGQDMRTNRDNYKVSVEINQDKRSRDDNHHASGPRRYSEIQSHRDRPRERTNKEKSRDRRRYRDTIESDLKEYRDTHEKRRRSRRDRSHDKDVKRSRVEEKHRTYYEIYAELDSRSHKGNEPKND